MATPHHRKTPEGGQPGGSRGLLRPAAIAGVVVLVLAAGAGVGVIGAQAGHGSPHPSGSPPASTTTTTAPVPPLSITSITPSPSAKGVDTQSAIVVSFSQPLAADAPVPTLAPAVAGHWTLSGSRFVFQPAAGYIPSTTETVTVSSSVSAFEGVKTVKLGKRYLSSFDVQNGSFERLQELLAELRYLPLTFTAATVTTAASTTPAKTVSALEAEPTSADAVKTSALPGKFTWAYPNIPATLAAQWSQGAGNGLTRAAVMAFEADHGLAVDGVAGPEVWSALLKAVATRDVDRRPYSYIEVTERSPETLSVWQEGRIVFTSLANTGVPGAATQLGTYPIYTHDVSTMMKGTDVDGTKYDVRVQYVGYFYNGDAVHGYPRASYGYPQSNGCVELPIPAAAELFNSGINFYGTLVTVSPA